MRTIKRQLRQFYAAQGIGARRAEKLIKSDLNAVRRAAFLSEGPQHGDELIQVMVWKHTPQGVLYWAARQDTSWALPEDHPSPLHA